MELICLTVLNYNLNYPTAKEFLKRALKAARADPALIFLASYLCELTLVEYTFATDFLPSTIGAAAVCFGLHTLKREPWNPTLQYYTEYSPSDPKFRTCVAEISKLHTRNLDEKFKAIRDKYSCPKYYRVSSIQPASTLPFE
jgi:hypothetical protein